MAAINLSRIKFRAFMPDHENPVVLSPATYVPTNGAVNLSGIKFRVYEEDTEQEQ